MGGTIDGFTRVSRGTALQPLRAIPKHPAQPTAKVYSPLHVKPVRTAHAPAVSVKPHAQQKATTLMRSAVKKPVIKSATVIKAQTRTDLLAKAPMQTVAPKLSVSAIDPTRHRRAERMIKSPAVSHYARPSATVQASSYTLTPTHHHSPVSHHSAVQPQPAAQAIAAHKPVLTDLRPAVASRPSGTHAPAMQRMHPAATRKPASKTDMFDDAIARSISHEQTYDQRPTRTRKRGRFFRFAAGTAAVLAVIGFLAYYNAPALSLKIASYRAGLQATLPSQQPSGFNLGYLDYQPGNITANFTSEQDGRQYNITQKASSWDSQALLSNFVASANSAYKTYQRAGRTVYVLSNNTATWVDSGIWYTVDGNASLTSQQVLDLASSM
jgi:hypothetical protein